MLRPVHLFATLLFCLLVLPVDHCIEAARAMKHTDEHGKNAIVLAHFGTTVVSGLPAINTISEEVRKAFPDTEVRLTFTSNIVRSVWKKRQADAQAWLDQGVPKEILYVKNIIATIGDLLEDGYSNIIVQPSHMFYMEQSHDLQQYVRGLASIKTMKERWRPFDTLVMGRPALGMPGDRYSYHEDIRDVAKTLAGDADFAKQEGALLLYMGHGNEHWSTGIYGETQAVLHEMYPQVQSFIGVVEGLPSLDVLLPQLKATGVKKIMIKPFMIVAGDHATNDMAGEESDSWKSILEKEGFEVQPVLTGLGENPQFARIFVRHIQDAAAERGLTLK